MVSSGMTVCKLKGLFHTQISYPQQTLKTVLSLGINFKIGGDAIVNLILAPTFYNSEVEAEKG